MPKDRAPMTATDITAASGGESKDEAVLVPEPADRLTATLDLDIPPLRPGAAATAATGDNTLLLSARRTIR